LKKNAGFQFKIHKLAQRELEKMASKGESVPWRRFVSTMKKKSLLERAFKDQLAVHRWGNFCATVTDIFNKIKATVPVTAGKQASYIPELGNVDPNLFGMSICTVDGQMFSIGDAEDHPLEAAANPLLYSLLVERLGYDKVHEYIGKEPSGSYFNAFTLNGQNRPHNACVNTGAIVMCNLFEPNKQSSERFRALLGGVSDLAGAKCGFSQAVYLSEKATAMRNFALAHFMASNGALTKDSKQINDSLDFYFQLCSIEANCQRLATVAATYANNGVNPITGERVLHASTVKQTVAMLYSCGVYIKSGEWACNVGLPSKTGISGCIWLVIPGVAGVAIHAPPCDENGTSVRAAALAKALADRFSWHLFDVLYSTFT
jgi:glutaminase